MGNTLTVYGNKDGSADWYRKEQHLYGSSRLGIWESDLLFGSDSQVNDWKTLVNAQFELIRIT
jgi:hypothetical protein